MSDAANPLRLDLTPSYEYGFSFTWSVAGSYVGAAPWRFVIQESTTTPDAWVQISPVLTNVYAWRDTVRRIPEKDCLLYYRVVLTPGGDNSRVVSEPVAPWGLLNRREWLLVRDIMRREILHARTLAGTLGAIWSKNTYGPKCPKCVDPITGQIRNSNCSVCLGTGYVPPYHGPYETWMTFSPTNRQVGFNSDGAGLKQQSDFTVRLVGTMGLQVQDIISDPSTDRRYTVLASRPLAEIRRVPVVQELNVSELATTDAAYRLTSARTGTPSI